MESYYPGLPENSLQICLIEKKARELGLPSESITEEWIDNFSIVFRALWNSGIRTLQEIEDKIYQVPKVTSNYSDMITAILTRDPSLIQ